MFLKTVLKLHKPTQGNFLKDSTLQTTKHAFLFTWIAVFLQMCLAAAINVIQHHMDFYVLLCVRWAISLLWRQRKAVAEIWPRQCCFPATVMAFQYLLCLGPSPAFCRGLFSTVIRSGELRTQKGPKINLGKAQQRRAGGFLPFQLCKGRAPRWEVGSQPTLPGCSGTLWVLRRLMRAPTRGCRQRFEAWVAKAASSGFVFICPTVRKAVISCTVTTKICSRSGRRAFSVSFQAAFLPAS